MGVTVREKTKGSGVWWVFITHNGRRRSKAVGSKTAAMSAKKKIERELLLNNLKINEKQIPKFHQYAREWVEKFIAPRRAATTYTRYSGVINNKLKQYIGKQPIDEITRGDLKRMLLREFEKGASPSSVGIMLNVVSGIMFSAIDDEYITTNPASNLTRTLDINRQKKTKDIEPLMTEEVEAILGTIATHYPTYYTFFLTAFRTACRVGELCALQWDDINYIKKTIYIRRTAKDQTVKDATKTYASRKIEISSQLLEELQRHKKEDAKICLKEGIPQKFIFHHGGSLYAQNTIRRVWHKVLKKCGIEKRRIHDIRHTVASTLLAKGVPVSAVANFLGHSSPQITLTVYAHFMPSENVGFTDLLDVTHSDVNMGVHGCV